MGSYTKIYTRSFHPEDTLLLTWDIGYTNVAIYRGDRLVHQFEKAGQFTKGAVIQDPSLGKIRVKFTETKPLQLELKVNGKKYKPTRKGKQDIDLSGAIAIYWAMMAFTALLLILTYTIKELYGLFGKMEGIGILAGITGVYLFSALLMSYKKHWAFFIGYGYMILSTAWFLFVILQTGFDLAILILLIIRIVFVIYLTLSIRKVLFAMRLDAQHETKDILDKPFD